MAYPRRLLPQQNFNRIAWNESLRNCYLIHFTETTDLIDPATSKLRITLVVKQTDHLRDYSNNLLGVFLVDDIFWASQDCPRSEYFRAEWDGVSEIVPPDVPAEFTRNETRGYFFLRISQCHEDVVQFQDNTFVHPVCMLLHTPTNSNFWHFSLRWFFEGRDLESWTNGIKRRMKTSAKAFIVERAFFDEPFYEQLDPAIYSR